MKKMIGLTLVVLFASMFVMATGALAQTWVQQAMSRQLQAAMYKVQDTVAGRTYLYGADAKLVSDANKEMADAQAGGYTACVLDDQAFVRDSVSRAFLGS
jgi:hypothetical protein